MKWLIIQSDGAHKGQDSWTPNWYMRECYSLQDALRRNGEEAEIWGFGHGNFLFPPDFNSFDVVVIAENYDFGWMPDLSKITKPKKIHWVIDLHCQPWTNYYRISEACDIVLHATQPYVETYERHVPGAKHYWFPNAIDDRFFNVNEEHERSINIVFIGGKGPSREKIIDRMVNEAGMFYGYGITGKDYVSALQHAKIGFNKNLSDDMNYRTFESLGCGACLLTERNWNLEKLGFVDGTNCVLYESESHAVHQARELLSRGTWEPIGREGRKLAKRHTYFERIKPIIALCKT